MIATRRSFLRYLGAATAGVALTPVARGLDIGLYSGSREPVLDPRGATPLGSDQVLWRQLLRDGDSILGPIRIGEGSRIGAGAVVVRDVAPQTPVVGWAARPVGVRGSFGRVEDRLTALEESARSVGSAPAQFDLGAGI